MKDDIKTWAISGYLGIGFFFAVYQHLWGHYKYKSFMFNIGQGLIWPAVMFPSVGKFIGGMLLLIIIGALTLRSR